MNSLMKFKKVFILGVGGSGMSSIAKYLNQKGLNVTGYDQRKSYVTNLLNQDGIKVIFDEEMITFNDDCLYIYSSAINLNSDRFSKFKDKDNVISRPEFLERLSKENKIIGITGTHGKTSTTALLAHIFHFNNIDVSYLYGGVTAFNGIGGHFGNDELPIILETDEAFNTFKNIKISDLLVLNIDSDHLDFFGNFENYRYAFYNVMNNVIDNLVLNNDDKNLKEFKSPKQFTTYGKTKDSNFYIKTKDSFIYNKRKYDIKTKLIGDHFKSNIIGAVILAYQNGVKIEDSLQAIKSFPGVKRRTELIGIADFIHVYDDYGHHPTEMNATIKAMKNLAKNKLYVVFQPHRYTRTKEYFNEFKKSLQSSDYSIALDIYPAGESPIPGVTSKNFEGKNVKYLKSIRYVPEYLSQKVQPGDVILTLGAGDITLLGPKILKYLDENK